MAQLIVRNLDEQIVQTLRSRAAHNGRSAEAEHREILRKSLLSPPVQPFKDFLLTMPDAGDDEDFKRQRDTGRQVDL